MRGFSTPWRLRRPGALLTESYARNLFADAALRDLPDRPHITFLSVDLNEGVTFRFSKSRIGDYCLGWTERPDHYVAECGRALSAQVAPDNAESAAIISDNVVQYAQKMLQAINAKGSWDQIGHMVGR